MMRSTPSTPSIIVTEESSLPSHLPSLQPPHHKPKPQFQPAIPHHQPIMPPTLKYTTLVHGGPRHAPALAIFHDHAFFLSADPNLISFTADVAPPPGGSGPGGLHALPPAIKAVQKPDSATRCYEATDRMPPGAGAALISRMLPGLSTTTIYYEITDTTDGVFVFLRAPLGVTQERRWVLEEGEGEEGGLRIVEYVEIFCSRLLYGTVKAQQEQSWKEAHAKYVRKMGGEVGAQSGT